MTDIDVCGGESKPNGLEMDRRQFLTGLGKILGYAIVATSLPVVLEHPDHEKATEGATNHVEDNPAPLSVEEPPSSNEPHIPETFIPNRGSIVDTILRTVAVSTGNVFLNTLLNRVGIKSGNANALERPKSEEEQLDRFESLAQVKPTKMAAYLGYIGIGVPVIEELAFRKMPSDMVNRRGGKSNNWRTGVATSGLFALAHSRNSQTKETTIPVTHFNDGLFKWWLQRNRGYKHAVVSHIVNNSPVAAFGAYGYIKLRKLWNTL